MPAKKRIYAEITKSEKQDDGTIIVEGFASSGSVDSDGEVITPEAMKAAIPEYMRFANVREMHDAKKAAGTALEAEVLDDGRTRFVSHVVDPVAVLKVETGVYKGFSIGASIPKGGRDTAVKGKINQINLYEVSLVDRPSNPDAVFTCFKADTGPENEEEDPIDDEDVKKGLWNMQTLLSALGSLRDACHNVNYEVQAGEHTEKMATAIKECMLAVGEVTKKYLGEELGMLAGIGKADTGAVGEEQLTKVQGELATVTEELETLRKARAEREAADAADVETAAEIAKVIGVEVAKGSGPGALLKACVESVIAKQKEVDALRKRAAPGGARLNAIAISKGQDLTNIEEREVEPVKKYDGTDDEVATAIKKAHANPIPVGLPT